MSAQEVTSVGALLVALVSLVVSIVRPTIAARRAQRDERETKARVALEGLLGDEVLSARSYVLRASRQAPRVALRERDMEGRVRIASEMRWPYITAFHTIVWTVQVTVVRLRGVQDGEGGSPSAVAAAYSHLNAMVEEFNVAMLEWSSHLDDPGQALDLANAGLEGLPSTFDASTKAPIPAPGARFQLAEPDGDS